MTRAGRINLVLLLLLAVPALASAQRDSRYTREAQKFVGLAMTRSSDAERATQYQEALKHLREGMEKDAGNAKVWLLAGTVLSNLGEAQEADAAFKKAVELHADYAEEVRHERHAAWAELFNAGVGAMDAQQYDEAIRLMENAQVLFAERPEALMNLGLLYANRNDLAKAEQAFRDAERATSSPLFATLEAEEQASWLRFRDMAKVSIAQMSLSRGVNAFQEEKFDEAFAEFAKAIESNPHSRDAIFNQAQALWAHASSLETALAAMPEGSADRPATQEKILKLYGDAETIAKRTLEIDPNNDALYAIIINASRVRGEFAADEATKQTHREAALAMLEAQDKLDVLLDEVAVVPGPEESTIQGKIKNMKLAPGAQVKIRFVLLGLDGSQVGEQEVTATVGAVEESTSFEAKVVPTGEVAGWKYSIVK
jgi:tetratricopeptide (TPR) repeat protein